MDPERAKKEFGNDPTIQYLTGNPDESFIPSLWNTTLDAERLTEIDILKGMNRQERQEYNAKKGKIDIGEHFSEKKDNREYMLFTVLPFLKNHEFKQSLDRLQTDKYESPIDKRKDQIIVLDKLLLIEEMQDRGMTLGAEVGDAVANMVKYAGEIGLMAGLGGTGVGTAAYRGVRRPLVKFLGKKVGGGLAKQAGKIAFAAHGAAMNVPALANITLERMTDKGELDDKGEFIRTEKGQSLAKALPKSFAEQVATYWTEQQGEVFAKGLKGIGGKVIEKLPPGLASVIRKSGKLTKPFYDLVKKGKLDGMIPEMIEEYIDRIIKPALMLDDQYRNKDNAYITRVAKSFVPDPRELLIQTVLFGALPVIGGAYGATKSGAVKLADTLRKSEKEQIVEKTQTKADLKTDQFPISEVPVESLKLSKDVPNFKEGANKDTGVVQGEELHGRYNRLGTAPILVWQRDNGELEVITGRHRLDLAKRMGEKSIPAQVVKESDGFDKAMALTADAESNIRDGQGSIKDYAQYFKNTEIDEKIARESGLLSRIKGKTGFVIGKSAVDDVYARFLGGKLSESKTAAIANGAPNLESAQLAAAAKADKLSPDELEQYASILARTKPSDNIKATQGNLFGFDDSALKEAEAVAKEVSKETASVKDRILAVKGALKRPEVARKMGLEFSDEEHIRQEVSQLEDRLEALKRVSTTPELYQEMKRRTGLVNNTEKSAKPVTDLLGNEVKDIGNLTGKQKDFGFVVQPAPQKDIQFKPELLTKIKQLLNDDAVRSAKTKTSLKYHTSEDMFDVLKKEDDSLFIEPLNEKLQDKEIFSAFKEATEGKDMFEEKLAVADKILDEIRNSYAGDKAPSMIKLYQQLGSSQEPNVRLQDAEELGRMYEKLKDDEVTQKKYNAFVQNLLDTPEHKKYITDAVSRYDKKYAYTRIVNIDMAKQILPDYDPANIENERKYFGDAAEVSGKVYDKWIKDRKGKGNNIVLFMAGGTGSGKSTVANDLSRKVNHAIIVDSTLTSKDYAVDQIDKALENGYDVAVRYIYREPVDAWENGVWTRWLDEKGHFVPADIFLNTHIKSKENLLDLAQKYGDKIKIEVYENHSYSNIKEIPLDELRTKKYDVEAVKDKINAISRQKIEQYGIRPAEETKDFFVSETNKADGSGSTEQKEPTIQGETGQQKQVKEQTPPSGSSSIGDPVVDMPSKQGGFAVYGSPAATAPAPAKLSAIVKEDMSTGSKAADDFLHRTKNTTTAKGQAGPLKRVARGIAKFVKDFHFLTELPKTEYFAKAREAFRQIIEVPKIAYNTAIEDMQCALQPVSGTSTEANKRVQAVRMKLIADDLYEDVQNNLELPPGMTVEDVEAMKVRADELYNKYPTVKESYDRIRQKTQVVTDMLVSEGWLDPDQAKEFYYPHKVLKYLRDNDSFLGISRKPATPKKAYLKQRKGGADYSTDVLERLVEHWSQVRRDIETTRFLEKVLKEEQAEYFKKEYPDWTPYTKTEDGKKVKNLLPPGYKEVTVLPGRYYYKANGVTEDLAMALMNQNLELIESILEEQGFKGKMPVRTMLALGKKRSFIVRDEVARQLNDMPTVPVGGDNGMYQAVKAGNTFIKRNILFNPLYAVPFHLTNFVGDAHKVAVALPGALKPKHLKSYWQSIIDTHKGNKPELFGEAQRTGVIGAGWIGADVKAMETIIPEIERAEISGNTAMIYNKAKRLFNVVRAAGESREDWLRYATFEYLVNLQEQGIDITKYAVKDVKVVCGLTNPSDKAAKVARDICGDYAAIGKSGQMLSDLTMQFYRWMHLNIPWWPRMIKEYTKRGDAGRLIAALLAAAAPYIISLLWNYSDDERRKYEESLPYWKRFNFHIVSLHGKKMYYIPLPLDDFMNFIGVPETALDFQRFQRGMINAPELWKRIAINFTYEPAMSVVNAVGGVVGVVRDLIGLQTYPDVRPWLEKRWSVKSLRALSTTFGSPGQLAESIRRGDIRIDDKTNQLILSPRAQDMLNRSWMGIRSYTGDLEKSREMLKGSVYKKNQAGHTQGDYYGSGKQYKRTVEPHRQGEAHKGKQRQVDSLKIQLENER